MLLKGEEERDMEMAHQTSLLGRDSRMIVDTYQHFLPPHAPLVSASSAAVAVDG